MPHILPDDIAYVGINLKRPECVLATASGDVFCSNGAKGVAMIKPDGRQFDLARPLNHNGFPVLSNGIVMRSNKSFVVANIADGGGLFALEKQELKLLHPGGPNGESLPVNFVYLDQLGKLWVTVSTRQIPRAKAYRQHVADGFLAVFEDGRLNVVLDGLAYANEIRTDYENGWLYIAETMGQRISRIKLSATGVFGEPEVFAKLPEGAFVDGLEIDAAGAVIAICIVSAQVFRITPDRQMDVVFSERNEEWVLQAQSAFEAGQLDRKHLDNSPTKVLRNVSSVACFGDNLERLVFGNILEDRLLSCRAPFTCRKPHHWNFESPTWGQMVAE